MMFRIFPQVPDFPFMKFKLVFVFVSAFLVIASLASIVTQGFKFGVDFAGGVQMVIKFPAESQVDVEKLREELANMGLEASVQTFGTAMDRLTEGFNEDAGKTKEYIIQFSDAFINVERNQQLVEAQFKDLEKDEVSVVREFRFSGIEKAYFRLGIDLPPEEVEKRIRSANFAPLELESILPFGRSSSREFEVRFQNVSNRIFESLKQKYEVAGAAPVELQKVDFVGARVGSDLKTSAILSIIIALAAIFLFVFIRYDLAYAPGGVIALAHDVIVVAGIFSFFRMEMDLTIVAALLTIAGYSINDTIIIFDRIREVRGALKGKQLEDIMNLAINQTLSRTVITSLCVLMAVAILWILGGAVIHGLAFALVAGTIIGSYSTIFVASPLALWTSYYLDRKGAPGSKKVVAA